MDDELTVREREAKAIERAHINAALQHTGWPTVPAEADLALGLPLPRRLDRIAARGLRALRESQRAQG